MEIKRIKVIGIGLNPKLIPEHILKDIHSSDVLVGGTRLLEEFKSFSGIKIPIKGDISSLFATLKTHYHNKRITILTSGDPLFYGIGTRLVQEFGYENVEITPNVTSMQYLFSRIGESWANVPVISFHSSFDRGKNELLTRISEGYLTIFILTSPENHPRKIASILVEYGFDDAQMIIGSDLGTEHEKISSSTAKEVFKSDTKFGNLSSIILKLNENNKRPSLGGDEKLYRHQNGLITKSEIRAITLSKLQLCKEDLLWDIGAGSGAISIEASLFVLPHNIYAIEKDPFRAQDIRENMRYFSTPTINLIVGRAPECLDSLPSPTKVFIGGSDNNICEILDVVINRLTRPGIVVLNIVLLETLQKVLKFLNDRDMDFELIQVIINKSQDLNSRKILKPLNPCWILKIECN